MNNKCRHFCTLINFDESNYKCSNCGELLSKAIYPIERKRNKKEIIKLMDALDLLDKMASEAVQGDSQAWVAKGLAYNLLMEFIHSK